MSQGRGILLALAIIMVFFEVMTDGTLMQPLNITNLLLQNSYIVIMALAMLLIIVAGHIDLSVGSVAGFIGGLAAVLMVELQWHYIPAAIVCLLVGAMIGGLQGYFVAFHKIPAFIVTLGGMLVFRGLVAAERRVGFGVVWSLISHVPTVGRRPRPGEGVAPRRIPRR